MIESAEEFKILRESNIPNEYHRSAHEEASFETWLEVVNKYPELLEWVIYNKTVPLKILEMYKNYPDSRIRYAIAVKRKLSYEIFELLSNDNDESVRMAIARNKKTPESILQKMANDDWEEIRILVKERLEKYHNKRE